MERAPLPRLRRVQAPQNRPHLERVLLLLLVFLPLRVLIRILLRPIVVLLLDLEAFDVVGVHDLLDALVVVEDGQTGHLVEIRQMAVIAVTSADELVRCGLERVSLEVRVLHRVLHPLLVRLLRPIWHRTVVEVGGNAELTVEDFRLALEFLFDVLLVAQVVVILMHRELIILDLGLGKGLGDGNEGPFEDFADWSAMRVSDDVPVADLLVDRWVVDESAFSLRRLKHVHLHVLHRSTQIGVTFLSQVRIVAHHAVKHVLKVILRAELLRCNEILRCSVLGDHLAYAVRDVELFCWNAVIHHRVDLFIGDRAMEG